MEMKNGKYGIEHGSATYGPRAGTGPPVHIIRPAIL